MDSRNSRRYDVIIKGEEFFMKYIELRNFVSAHTSDEPLGFVVRMYNIDELNHDEELEIFLNGTSIIITRIN
jgi:hypothetical protein